jgi:hypothetical protein
MLLNGTRLAGGGLAAESEGLRKSRIVKIDYAGGIVEIADPVLLEGVNLPRTVVVAPDGFGDCLTLCEVLDRKRFSIGNEDLVVGGGPVTGVTADRSRLLTTAASPFAQTGMTVLNSRGEVQGRVSTGDRWTLDRTGLPPLREEDFPAAAGAAGPRFSIVCAGPGDEVLIPSLVILTRTAAGDTEMTATSRAAHSAPGRAAGPGAYRRSLSRP